MKNLPLALQIWIVCAGVTLCVFILIAVFLPMMLRNFFTQQVYDILQDSQKTLTYVNVTGPVMLPPFEIPPGLESVPAKAVPGIKVKMATEPSFEIEAAAGKASAPKDFVLFSSVSGVRELPMVRHMVLAEGISHGNPMLPEPFFKAVEEDASRQKEDVREYSREIDRSTLFYVIRKEQIQGKPGYMVSFAWSNYRNDMVEAMFWQLMGVMVLLILLSLPPSLWLSRYLTRPLVQMEGHITRIAGRDWHEPFRLDRRDEIGKLARTFENMRQRLVRQDKAQQSFLQHISHELKTPVMVIRSYVQSIQDGIYPKGTLSGSIDVISGEALRLEKRIHDLLYLNKINYISSREPVFQSFDLAAVISQSVDRFRCRRSDLLWDVSLTPVWIKGDPEQWGVAVENLLDNQTRYAKKRIELKLYSVEEGKKALIRIWNDGPPIDPDIMDSLFETYQTGKGGEFGLGLAIVKQIIELHRAVIRVNNEDGGVAFCIDLDQSIRKN